MKQIQWGLLCLGLLSVALMGAQGGCGPSVCDFNGKSYQVGDSFPSSDGCNTCTCGANGQVACTRKACINACGGTTGVRCATGSYCVHPKGTCGANNASGTCEKKPEDCNTAYLPVCGCNGITYGNACGAAAAGVSIKSDGKCPPGPGKSCEHKGKTYSDQEVFRDDCNSCQCQNGKVGCTLINCDRICEHDGKGYREGGTYTAADGCNTCTCQAGGQWACTKKACPPSSCQYNGKEYKEGDTFPATDGCNTCTCQGGSVGCTKIKCPPVGCTHDGKTHNEGETFPAGDGCNTCTCTNGKVACTEKACPPSTCQYNGKEYKDGDSFPSDDGCNTCTCKSGQVGCTKKACAGCTYNGQSYNAGETFPSSDGCNTCTCQSGQVACTKKACSQACGSRGLKPCPTDQYCNQPKHCGATDLPGSCTAIPKGCTKEYKPVCGCDNKTYGNACMAAAAGVSVQTSGVCPITKGCTYNGTSYKEGASFPAGDGCNTCSCSNGQVACTKKACKQACGSRGLKPCPTGEYCNQPSHCGATDIPGTCEEQPTVCNRLYDPVCGCDNKTYGNACGAASAGVSVQYKGKCKPTP